MCRVAPVEPPECCNKNLTQVYRDSRPALARWMAIAVATKHCSVLGIMIMHVRCRISASLHCTTPTATSHPVKTATRLLSRAKTTSPCSSSKELTLLTEHPSIARKREGQELMFQNWTSLEHRTPTRSLESSLQAIQAVKHHLLMPAHI